MTTHLITKEWLDKHRTSRGGFTRAQAAAVGFSWPPPKNWVRNLVGMEITASQARQFETRNAVVEKKVHMSSLAAKAKKLDRSDLLKLRDRIDMLLVECE